MFEKVTRMNTLVELHRQRRRIAWLWRVTVVALLQRRLRATVVPQFLER
jgi:hypothetical protein